jgi:putative hydrolase of the HAD superfamily
LIRPLFIPTEHCLEGVLFDLDDTLHDDTEAYHRAAEHVATNIASERGVDAEALRRAYVAEAEAFWENLGAQHLDTRMGGLRKRMWLGALRLVGIEDEALAQSAADAYNRYRKGYLKLFPGVLELFAVLRARGIKLGIITNGFAETHREKIALLELENEFDEIFIADEVGMVKPDPRIFLHACERLGVNPQRTAMVGDRFDRDVVGAQEAGLRAVWFNVRAENIPPQAVAPEGTVTDIEQLAALLRSWSEVVS